MRDLDDTELLAGILLACLFVPLLFGVYLQSKDFDEWEKFAAEHGCKVVREAKGSLMPVVVGRVTFFSETTPIKTYLCDDGRKYEKPW